MTVDAKRVKCRSDFMTNKDKCFLSYVAGLLDGEGYIGIIKGNNWMGHRYWLSHIEICMTDPLSLLIISSLYSQFHFSVRKIKSNRKQAYRISIQKTDDCYRFLKLIQPYLFVKWEQAKIMLSYLAWRRKNLWLTNGINWLSGDKKVEREKLLDEYHKKSEKFYWLLRQKKQESLNGVKTVELLNRMDLRQYRAKREDVDNLRDQVKNLLEGVETKMRQSTDNKSINAPEKDIVQCNKH